jgi:hypothetical protein
MMEACERKNKARTKPSRSGKMRSQKIRGKYEKKPIKNRYQMNWNNEIARRVTDIAREITRK